MPSTPATTQHRDPPPAPVELLAPAGGPDAGYAALAYGADAVYLGLPQFSARATAENFTPAQADEFVAYAHSLTPRRRVFVTVNTLIQQREVPALLETLAFLAELRVDAVIVQDLGVYALLREHFPELPLDASTQMAVHNHQGAEALQRLGFRRVTLARELTLNEVRQVAAVPGLETEVFVHGALCYSYSGLCLFSSHLTGRSANRGRCAYPCRDEFAFPGEAGHEAQRGHVFSMKDLALPEALPALRAAGVRALKIEGRKKTALYVAAVTRYYRGLLDGTLDVAGAAEAAADLKAIFSRPWTTLYLHDRRQASIVERELVGPRGLLLGQVSGVRRQERTHWLRFTSAYALERHDGVQVDLPQAERPYGFAVEALRVRRGQEWHDEFAAPAGAELEVPLPAGHPDVPVGAPVSCSSAQAVKRRYPLTRPKPGAFRTRRALAVTAELQAKRLSLSARVAPGCTGEAEQVVNLDFAGEFAAARDVEAVARAAATAFGRLGDTALALDHWYWRNPEGRFIPVSHLNECRRALTAAVDQAMKGARTALLAQLRESVAPHPSAKSTDHGLRWLLKTDAPECLRELTADDWAAAAEVIVTLIPETLSALPSHLAELAGHVGRDRIRLALPMLCREWEETGLLTAIRDLLAAGWTRWEVANLWGWTALGDMAALDVTADWPLYALNHLAGRQLLALGLRRFTLSPEDGRENLAAQLAELSESGMVVVYQDTPLFISETCPRRVLADGACRNCVCEPLRARSPHGQEFLLVTRGCRTVTLNRQPFCLGPHLPELAAAGVRWVRVEFCWRPYTPAEVRDCWQRLCRGGAIAGTHDGNYARGLE